MKKPNFDLNDGAENPDEEPVSRVTPAPPPVLPPQLITLTTDQFQQLLSASQGAAAATNNDALAQAITTGMQQMQSPIPENKTSDGKSDANPLGEAAHPMPNLKCEFWMGVVDDQDKDEVKRWYEIDPRDLTAWERCALNTLEPIEKTICMLGSETPDFPVLVVAKRHQVTQALQQMTIAVPLRFVQKKSEHKNFVPNLISLVHQLTGHNFSRKQIDLDDLQYYMGEHRQQRYIGPATPTTTAAA